MRAVLVNRFARTVLLMGVAGSLSSACDGSRTAAPPPDLAPVASTPAAAVQRLAWAFDHRDVAVVAGLLSADAKFMGVEADSAGNGSQTMEWSREELLLALRSMFEGVPGVSEPASVKLTFDRNLIPFPDPRPGHDARVHRTMRSSLDLVVDDPTLQSTFEVSGYALFYVPRGDSTAIPAEEVARGLAPDSTRWWIDRWEDETVGSGAAHANPANRWSLFDLLRFYRDRVVR